MARAYPASCFHGFDNHAPSVEHARRAAEEAVANDDALREVVTQAGFKEFRRATQTPFNRVFEARL